MTAFIYSTRDIHGTQDSADVVIVPELNIGGPRNGDGVGEAPVITVASVVTGTNAVGELLTGTAPTVTGTPAPVVTHQWRRGGVVMSPAQTGATYTQVSADVGFAIDRLDTAVNAYGFDEADSNDITIPATTTSWTNGAGTNLASNPLNWNHGLPSASVDTVFDDAASPDECIIDGSEHFKTFDARDYTGNIHIASSDLAYFSVHGDVFLDAGMGTPGTIIIVFKDDAELDTGGFPSVGIVANTASKTLSIVSHVAGQILQTSSSHVVDLAAGKVITFNDASLADAAPIEWNSSEAMVFGAGSKIVLNCTYGIGINGTGDLLCPIEVGAASSTVTFAGSGFSAQTYTQAGGTLSASGLFTTVGNFSKSAGSVTSSNIAVGGNFSSTGGTLVTVTANVTGTAVASNTSISGSNFSAGTDLDATNNCTDNGGNDASVVFVVVPVYATWDPASLADHTLSNGNLTDTIVGTNGNWKASASTKTAGVHIVQILHDTVAANPDLFVGARRAVGNYACLCINNATTQIFLTGVAQGSPITVFASGQYSYHVFDLDTGFYSAYDDAGTLIGSYALPTWVAGQAWAMVCMADYGDTEVLTANFGATALTATGQAIATATGATGWTI